VTLLSHESYCPTCNAGGEGKYRGRVYDILEREYMTCPTCDGADGIVATESREPANARIREQIDALEAIHREQVARLVRDIWKTRDEMEHELRQSTLRQRQAERECDRLRVIVQAQARLLDNSQPAKHEGQRVTAGPR
jgi:aminoglycoside phosphotransferase (APT) family kinase protein